MRFKATRLYHPISDHGFSLIELMVTVAIVGILAAIALPSYTQYVIRGKLTEATATLSGHRVKMEQFYQDNRVYTGACAAGTIATTPANTANFSYACSPVPAAETYTIRATGLGSMAPTVLSIDQSNVRRTNTPPAGWAPANGNCWIQKKSGQC